MESDDEKDDFERQTKLLKKLQKRKSLMEDDEWFLLNTAWARQWRRWLIDESSERPGPVNNGPLFMIGTNVLRPELVEDIDFTFVPEEAWNDLVKWYGLAEGQVPVIRKVVDDGVFKESLSIEVYQVALSLCHCEDKDTCLTEYFSRTATIEQVEKAMKKLFGIADDKETKLWSKYMTNTYEPLKKLSNTLVDASVNDGHVIVIEERHMDGTWPMDDMTKNTSSTSALNTMKPGACGLLNLGNTCYLNSILQLLSHVQPLRDYMISGNWKNELNRNSLDGTNGCLATCFANVITQMWSGSCKKLAPRDLKAAVGKFKPEFSDDKRQDAQELMSFLLDGLHEDLNRIRKKPYIETKEADNRPDEEVAAEAWTDHLRRENSVIVDIFHGLLKSTLVCPECNKVSVKFDPFCYLSLPLPVKERQMTIFFVPVNSKLKIRQCKVSIAENGNVEDLTRAVSSLTGSLNDQLIVTNVVNHVFVTFYRRSDLITDVPDSDCIVVFELPVKSTSDPDTVLVPVYLREISDDTDHCKLFGMPCLVTFPRNSCSFKVIYDTLFNHMIRYIHCNDESSGSQPVDALALAARIETESSSLVEKQIPRIFGLKIVSSCGSTNYEEIMDNGMPVKFHKKMYLATDWTTKSRERFYNRKEAEAITVDESMKQTPTVRKTIQLADCLGMYSSPAYLSANDKWFCSKCNKHRQATKKSDIFRLPNILVIHLMRFSYSGDQKKKICDFVDYPVNDLDMSRFVINPKQGPAMYDLIAVSNHHEEGAGHYTAYAKNKDINQWFHFDDPTVSQSNEESVVTKASYVLVYQLQMTGSDKLGASKP